MRTKMTSRLLAAALAIVMVAGLLPMSALAARREDDDAVQLTPAEQVVDSHPAPSVKAATSAEETSAEPVYEYVLAEDGPVDGGVYAIYTNRSATEALGENRVLYYAGGSATTTNQVQASAISSDSKKLTLTTSFDAKTQLWEAVAVEGGGMALKSLASETPKYLELSLNSGAAHAHAKVNETAQALTIERANTTNGRVGFKILQGSCSLNWSGGYYTHTADTNFPLRFYKRTEVLPARTPQDAIDEGKEVHYFGVSNGVFANDGMERTVTMLNTSKETVTEYAENTGYHLFSDGRVISAYYSVGSTKTAKHEAYTTSKDISSNGGYQFRLVSSGAYSNSYKLRSNTTTWYMTHEVWETTESDVPVRYVLKEAGEEFFVTPAATAGEYYIWYETEREQEPDPEPVTQRYATPQAAIDDGKVVKYLSFNSEPRYWFSGNSAYAIKLYQISGALSDITATTAITLDTDGIDSGKGYVIIAPDAVKIGVMHNVGDVTLQCDHNNNTQTQVCHTGTEGHVFVLTLESDGSWSIRSGANTYLSMEASGNQRKFKTGKTAFYITPASDPNDGTYYIWTTAEPQMGEKIRDNTDGMFNTQPNNTWVFTGGADVEGGWAQTRGNRNFMGHFEEYVRWKQASGGTNENTVNGFSEPRQRYTVNTARAGLKLGTIVSDGWQSLVADFDPKAVVYMVGADDTENFADNLTSFIDKALALRENKGFAVVIKSYDGALSALNTAVDTVAETYKTNVDKYSRLVVVTPSDITEMNAEGHYKLGKQLCDAVYGSSAGYPNTNFNTDHADWFTRKAAPSTYSDTAPTVQWTPAGMTVSLSGAFTYELRLDNGVTVSGSGTDSVTVADLPESRTYTLVTRSQGGATQYKTLTGAVGGGAANVEQSAAQAKIAQLVAGDEPLTWLFMGDSITHGAAWTAGHDSVSQTFDKYLDMLGRPQDVVINTAVSSAETRSTLNAIQYRLNQYPAPDVVSIMLGTNDYTLVNNGAYTLADYTTNLTSIVAKIREKNADAVIVLRAPTGDFNTDNRKAYRDAMEEFATDNDLIFVDQWTEFREFAASYNAWAAPGQTQLYFGNSLHPGALGQLVMSKMFIKAIGLWNEDTPIADLDYEWPNMTAETSETVTATAVRQNKGVVTLDVSALGENLGETTLTATKDGQSWSVTAKAGEDPQMTLPDGAYSMTASSIKTNEAKTVTFAAGEVEVSAEAEATKMPAPPAIEVNYEYRLDKDGVNSGEMYVIFYNGNVAKSVLFHKTGNTNQITATIDDEVLTLAQNNNWTDDNSLWILSGSAENGYSIQNSASKKYLTITGTTGSGSGGGNTLADEAQLLSVEPVENQPGSYYISATVSGTRYYLHHNDSDGNDRFYHTTTEPTALELYKKGEVAPEMAPTTFKGTSSDGPLNKTATGSLNFRIPAMITLKNGWILAASDIRWRGSSDNPANIDSIVSISKDQGETWNWDVFNYFADHATTAGGSESAAFIDTAFAETEDGTVWMAVDATPAYGGNMNNDTSRNRMIPYSYEENLGFDDQGRIIVGHITDVTAATYHPETDGKYTYDYYADLYGTDALTENDGVEATVNGKTVTVYPICANADNVKTGYYVDVFGNTYYDYDDKGIQPVLVQQIGSTKIIHNSLFYLQSEWKVPCTFYLMIRSGTVDEENGCLVWSDPIFANVKNLHGEGDRPNANNERFTGICPGRGTVVKEGEYAGRIIFPLYDNASGTEYASVMYSDDNGVTWHRGGHADQLNGTGKSSESQIVELPGGKLRMYSRNTINYIGYADSTDGGETWGTYTIDYDLYSKNPGNGCMISFINVDGYLIAPDDTVYRNLIMGSYSREQRYYGVVRMGSYDEATGLVTWLDGDDYYFGTWTAEKTDSDFCYSCLAQLRDENGKYLNRVSDLIEYHAGRGDLPCVEIDFARLMGDGWSFLVDEVDIDALPKVEVESEENNEFASSIGVVDLNTQDVRDVTAKVTEQGTEDPDAVVTWKTSDPTVAVVEVKTDARRARLLADEPIEGREAVITAVGVGRAVITATTWTENGISRIDQVEVVVSDEDNITVPEKYDVQRPAADHSGATYPLDTDGLDDGVYAPSLYTTGKNRWATMHAQTGTTDQEGATISNNVMTGPLHDSDLWAVERLANGKYTIRSFSGDGKYLTSVASGAQLALSDTAEEFTITHVGNGDYTVQNAAGKYVACPDTSSAKWSMADSPANIRFFKQTNAAYGVDAAGLEAMIADAGAADIPARTQTAINEAMAAAEETYSTPMAAKEAQEKIDEATKLLYADLTGRAKAEPTTFTITFHANGGTGSMAAQTVTEGAAATLSANAFTRAGYTFSGWNTRADGRGTAYAEAAAAPEATVTLYAQWTQNDPGEDEYALGDVSERVYTGQAIQPAVIVRKNGVPMAASGYSVEYENNIQVGTATVTVTIPVTGGEDVALTTTFEIVAAPSVPSGGGSGGGVANTPAEEDLEDPDVPLAQLPALFEDVPAEAWFAADVNFVYENDLMQGVSETRFQPYMNTTRGMVVTILHRMEKMPGAAAAAFPDVTADAWYGPAVAWGVESGVVKGMDDGNFRPTADVTREQLALFLYRYAAYCGKDVDVRGDLSAFSDEAAVSAWAADAMSWAVGAGLIGGKDGNRLDPLSTATRGELATILTRFCQKFVQ